MEAINKLANQSKTFDEHPLKDPAIVRLLSRMPDSISQSFSTEQLFGLREAVGIRGGRIHSVDVRPTLRFPFVPWSFYVVFLLGKDRRTLSSKEKYTAALVLLSFVISFVLGLALLATLLLYLIKSALGINLFEGYSLGIWDWFRGR